ncbi:DUF6722 family protein [Parabacteroides gordonii]|uniref:Uncharacterized protein n=1 Tax=Parabacteroides gordonii MS-1 = DSM 23371 TaxID=1203610 RepID=A0A0F5JKX6_9BACT|nr:DUF6722 family protein [Parabacteroides gordonii]KKB58072.1 hypothetical protein HMPREF1536_01881 [Parabacteroides gordonii MS-1 = DSM 23371]MCA5582744.1 hypothetical protein [Parabacteroides gordonii]
MKNRRKTRIVPVPVIQEQIRKERISISKELGRYLLDVSKLVIGGAVITTVLQLNSDKYVVIAAAISLAIIFFMLGFGVLIFKKK